MNIEELTKKFKEEDENWSLEVLLNWLVKEKGIPQEIATAAIQATLIEMEAGNLNIDTHHGPDGFDNVVLRSAREYIQKAHELTIQTLSEDLEERMKKLVEDRTGSLEGKIKELTSGSRWSKAWKAIRGKL